MTFELYLDPSGDAPIPDGLPVVRSEVAFLELISASRVGVVQGSDLCRWAQDYARGRGIEVRVLSSPARRLSQLCPELTSEQARELAGRIGIELAMCEAPGLPQVAQWLWGEPWWTDEPGPVHAAQWLQWWVSRIPADAEQVLLAALGRWFRAEYPGPERDAYSVTSADAAYETLRSWLGLSSPLGWGGFPISLSENLVTALQKDFMAQVIQDPGRLVALVRAKQVEPRLLRVVAEVLARYYLAQPRQLTAEVLSTIQAYIDIPLREELRKLVLPPVPGPLPSDASKIGRWFIHEYLPYREWAPDKDPRVLEIGRSFAESYLRLYSSDALSDGPSRPHLSWVKARQLRRSDRVTLMVVLDGLGYADMKYLWDEICRFDSSKRLTVSQADVAFAPLPTITECAKPALLKGVKPSLADAQPDLGRVLIKDEQVQQALAEAVAGDLIIWKDPEPDSTYHNSSRKEVAKEVALKNARGILTGFAQRLTELVLRVPAEKPLQIVVTTDHGRLMAESSRLHALPEGALSRQRAALGDFGLRESLEIRDDVAYLHRSAYGLPKDCAVLLSGDAFVTQDGRQGVDAYPHGGIFPEEVLIPWWVIERDCRAYHPDVQLLGKGVAGRSGRFRLRIQNPNAIPLEAESLNVVSPQVLAFSVQSAIPPMDVVEWELEMPTWPTSRELEQFVVRLFYRLPDQRLAEVDAEVHLEVEEMYQQGDNPLEDLL